MKLFMLLFITSVIGISSMTIGAEDPVPDSPPYNGFIVSLEKHTMKGLSKAINDLVKEGFVIKSVNYHKTRSLVIINNGKCKNTAEGMAVARKYKSIKYIEPNWIITID